MPAIGSARTIVAEPHEKTTSSAIKANLVGAQELGPGAVSEQIELLLPAAVLHVAAGTVEDTLLWDGYAVRPLINTRALWREEKTLPDDDPSQPITRPIDPELERINNRVDRHFGFTNHSYSRPPRACSRTL